MEYPSWVSALKHRLFLIFFIKKSFHMLVFVALIAKLSDVHRSLSSSSVDLEAHLKNINYKIIKLKQPKPTLGSQGLVATGAWSRAGQSWEQKERRSGTALAARTQLWCRVVDVTDPFWALLISADPTQCGSRANLNVNKAFCLIGVELGINDYSTWSTKRFIFESNPNDTMSLLCPQD